jgi:hypothetical protein
MVEVLIGMSLAMVLMLAVLVSYVSLARNFTRTLGLSEAGRPTLEAQSLRTLAQFTQDVRMATGIVSVFVNSLSTPSAISLTLTLPTGSGTKNIGYYYNSTGAALTVTLASYSTRVPARSLVRVDGSNGATQVLHLGLLTCTFNYYDTSGNPYPTLPNYCPPGIKQLALTLTSQGGSNTNNTRTEIYQANSPRLLIRNKPLLP